MIHERRHFEVWTHHYCGSRSLATIYSLFASPTITDVRTPGLFTHCVQSKSSKVLLYFIERLSRWNRGLQIGRQPRAEADVSEIYSKISNGAHPLELVSTTRSGACSDTKSSKVGPVSKALLSLLFGEGGVTDDADAVARHRRPRTNELRKLGRLSIWR